MKFHIGSHLVEADSTHENLDGTQTFFSDPSNKTLPMNALQYEKVEFHSTFVRIQLKRTKSSTADLPSAYATSENTFCRIPP